MTSTHRRGLFLIAIVIVGNTAPGGWIGRASSRDATAQIAASTPNGSCFLLHEVGVGEIRREPSVSCRLRVSPQSTFKIPHALAALDAGVVTGADSQFAYDGSSQPFEAWRRDHTLQSAMRFSALWWFQRVAEKLGTQREHDYLRRLAYGNADSSSGLTTFWLGGSLVISPEEQKQFLLRLFASTLPVRQEAMRTVREILVQPQGMVVNASGEHPFRKPWPSGTVLSAKTGSGRDRSGQQVRWLVGATSAADDVPGCSSVASSAGTTRRRSRLSIWPPDHFTLRV